MKKRKLIKIIEFLMIILIIATCCGWIFFNKLKKNNEKIAVIEKNGIIIKEINLSKIEEPYTINIDSEYNTTILVEKDKISFQNAKCPDKICQKTGKISEQNQTAICLPNKISIRIKGAENSIDGVTG